MVLHQLAEGKFGGNVAVQDEEGVVFVLKKEVAG
jgi:hypothetical protein